MIKRSLDKQWAAESTYCSLTQRSFSFGLFSNKQDGLQSIKDVYYFQYSVVENANLVLQEG